MQPKKWDVPIKNNATGIPNDKRFYIMNNIFAFGDSIMKGIVTNASQIDDGTVKYIISDHGFVNRVGSSSGLNIRNLSRFGSTILGGLNNIDRHLHEIKHGDRVVLEFGGNDCNFDWKAIAANPTAVHTPEINLSQFHELYVKLIEKVRSVGAVPVLLSLPALLPQRFFDFVSKGLNKNNILKWLGGDVNYISNWHEQYNLEIFKLAAQYNVQVIDITTVFLERRTLGDFYCVDGMHPNEAGHELIAETILSLGLLPMASC